MIELFFYFVFTIPSILNLDYKRIFCIYNNFPKYISIIIRGKSARDRYLNFIFYSLSFLFYRRSTSNSSKSQLFKVIRDNLLFPIITRDKLSALNSSVHSPLSAHMLRHFNYLKSTTDTVVAF